MEMFTIIAYFVVICLFGVSGNQEEVVATKSGSVRGITQTTAISGIRVQKFLNIPYAEAPVGRLRFKKPQPKKPWNETLNSTGNIIVCIQPQSPNVIVTENCLILNVWTPFPRPKNASVMVWIHGGSFRTGMSGLYEGSTFVAVGGVILVTINYRLSALGFLTTGDERIKGNLGLYDQRLAMKWVKENIVYFGGNPKSITIFGESAGGASVSAHTLSKGSWDLFDRAIMQSGSMIMPWPVMTDSQIKDALKWFLLKVGCNNDERLPECLRNVTEDKWKAVANSKEFSSISIGPSVDGEFFSDYPQKIWAKSEVKNQDIIIGITRDEMFLDQQNLLYSSNNISVYLKHFEGLLKSQFTNSSKEVYKKARQLYVPDCVPSHLEALKLSIAFQSDRVMICAARYEAKLRSKLMNATKVYFYQYSHAKLVATGSLTGLYPYGLFGFAAHGADVESVFAWPINNTMFRPDDQTISMRMVLYWTNFAKTGDPNLGRRNLPIVVDNVDSLPRWPRHSDTEEEYLDMESFSQMTVRTKLREQHCEFLKDPEAFLQQKTSGSTKRFPVKTIWSIMATVYIILCLFY